MNFTERKKMKRLLVVLLSSVLLLCSTFLSKAVLADDESGNLPKNGEPKDNDDQVVDHDDKDKNKTAGECQGPKEGPAPEEKSQRRIYQAP